MAKANKNRARPRRRPKPQTKAHPRPAAQKGAAKSVTPAFLASTDWHPYILAALLLLGAFLRLFQFGEVPAGMQQDEVSSAYDAWALLNYGVDRNGFYNPSAHISWGDEQYALAVYLTMPFVWLFDLNVYSARAARLLLALAALPLTYWTARKIGGRGFGLCALFVLVVCPWHIMMSRMGADYSYLAPVILIAVCCLIKATDNPRWMIASAAVFALSFYAYGVAYIFVPLFALLVLVYAWRPRLLVFAPGAAVAGAAAVLIAILIATPLALYFVVNIFALDTIETWLFSAPRNETKSRFETVLGQFQGGALAFAWANFKGAVVMLWNSFDPAYNRAVTPNGGYLYPFSMLWWLPGLAWLAYDGRRRNNHTAIFIALWFAVGLSATVLAPAALPRMNVLLFPIVLGGGYALWKLLSWRPARWRPAGPVAGGAAGAALLAAVALFSHDYFTDYSDRQWWFFHTTLLPAVHTAAEAAPAEQRICVTNRINQPYIYVLFGQKIDPHEFIRTADINSEPQWHHVHSFGRWHFIPTQAAIAGDCRMFVVFNDELGRFQPADNYEVVRRFQYYSVVRKS